MRIHSCKNDNETVGLKTCRSAGRQSVFQERFCQEMCSAFQWYINKSSEQQLKMLNMCELKS